MTPCFITFWIWKPILYNVYIVYYNQMAVKLLNGLKSFVRASAESAVSAKSLVVSAVIISVARVVDVVAKVPTVWVTC
jgi:hypothetical protein